MKTIIALLTLAVFYTSCNCKKDIQLCEPTNPICAEVAPTNELCAAYFTRWFYDKSTNSCKQVGYSGCSAKGFATKQECEECKCR